MTTFLSWNLNGFRTRLEDFKLLLSRFSPSVVCLQETHLLPQHPLKVRRYKTYRTDIDDGSRAHGGVAVLVDDKICSKEVSVRSNLQVVCVRVRLGKK